MAGERHGMCDLTYNTAWEQYGICESAFIVTSFPSYRPLMHFVHRNGKMSRGMLTFASYKSPPLVCFFDWLVCMLNDCLIIDRHWSSFGSVCTNK
jgi:hypothetical protein